MLQLSPHVELTVSGADDVKRRTGAKTMKAIRVVSRIVTGLYILSFVCLVLIAGAFRVRAAEKPPRAQMFDNITVIGSPLVLSTPAEVDAAEAHLDIRFPTGYRDYVTKFGEGVLGGSYIRIYPPHRILGGSNNLLQWRQRISAYWFWDLGRDVLTKEEALQSVIIGDTLGGDELIVHPSNPERVLVLPRNRDEIYVAGDGLPEAMEWLCGSGALTEAFDERNFEPFDTRRAAE